ncbi:MAG: hypothetical protein JJT82_04215 [Legionellaceae bacterium]|nr:hypothetical protein [Legionellaceae bacterium]
MDRFFGFVLFFLGVLLGSLPVYAEPPATRVGMALVHGTNDHRSDAVGGYWKLDFLDTLAQALPEKNLLFVAHCDFGQYMWDEAAAGCLAEQLLTFIDEQKLDKVLLFTHSDGANVVRWILSNPTYDPRYFRLLGYVREVIALAPSSGGSPLADEAMNGGLFEESLGWLLGYRNNAVRQQRVANMGLFNQQIVLGAKGQPALAVPFRVIVGSNVEASPLSSASYCNGYLLNSALKISKIYLAPCSDGFLECRSQEAAGEVWFYDVQRTVGGKSLSHNQSRHHCFGLDSIILEHLAATGVTG